MQRFVFLFFALSLLTLAGLHAAALTFYLYWVYLWFDIPMHILGGATVALGYQSRFGLSKFAHKLSFGLISTLLFVLAVGLVWEGYEYVVAPTFKEGYLEDTIIDIVMDLLGGLIGYAVARALQKLSTV